MAAISLNQVVKRFGEVQTIHGIDLEIKDGEFTVFVGPSGCGKSTLLRLIAGLEEITSGTISIGNVDVSRAEPADRGVAMVFQSYALYPHMTVEENMGFGLKMADVDSSEIKKQVKQASDVLQLGPLLSRKPKELSGGQRQRVAIGQELDPVAGSQSTHGIQFWNWPGRFRLPGDADGDEGRPGTVHIWFLTAVPARPGLLRMLMPFKSCWRKMFGQIGSCSLHLRGVRRPAWWLGSVSSDLKETF